MNRLIAFAILLTAFMPAVSSAQSTALKFTNIKNGKTILIPEGKRVVLFDAAPPYVFFVPKKGKLVKAENGMVEFKKGKAGEIQTVKLSDVHMAGFQTPVSISTSIFFSLLGGTVPLWPGSTYALKKVNTKKWKLETVKM